MKKLGILGSTGKMGKALIELPPSPLFERISLSKNPLEFDCSTLHALIDFTHPHATQKNLELALAHKLPIVIGTTGLSPTLFHAIQKASLKLPILYSANFSIGITLMHLFLKNYSAYLNTAYIDIHETHHLEKKDLPSGTALHLASLFPDKEISLSSGPRSPQNLIIHSKRVPNHLGSHTLQCSFSKESLSLHHEVLSRSVYAQGALVAVEFLLKQKNGLYAFSDVFTT